MELENRDDGILSEEWSLKRYASLFRRGPNLRREITRREEELRLPALGAAVGMDFSNVRVQGTRTMHVIENVVDKICFTDSKIARLRTELMLYETIIATLTDKQRTFVELKYELGMRFEDVAIFMHISLDGAKYYARKILPIAENARKRHLGNQSIEQI
jgi:DNA-directed RNA polymerase specialized sigma24 family protein